MYRLETNTTKILPNNKLKTNFQPNKCKKNYLDISRKHTYTTKFKKFSKIA